MTDPQQVLVVDGLTETRDVLDAVFAPRGVRVDRVDSRRPGIASAARPRVVVLHEDRPARGDDDWNGAHRVVVGRAVLDSGSGSDETRIPQPFEYADLVRAVERCLNDETSAH